MKQDFYAILGVPRDADEKQIKASYRKLARQYHPDLNPNDKQAEARFKEVSQAYEVLSDPEKRAMYDKYGSNWDQVQQGGPPPGSAGNFNFHFDGDIGSIFDQFFGSGETPFANRRKPAPPHDIEKSVELTLEEIDSGTKRLLTFQVPDACKSCDGTGKVRLRSGRQCDHCQGSGQVRNPFGMMSPCPVCQGAGKITLEACPTCRGNGTIPTTRKVEVTIPAGIQDGKKLRVAGRGAAGVGNRNGDLYVLIKELPHAKFKRHGSDLETETSVDFTQAILGCEIKVETLRGSVSMKLPECTQNGQSFRLSGQGLTIKGSERGNLMVKVQIKMPREVTDEQKHLIQNFRAVAEVRS